VRASEVLGEGDHEVSLQFDYDGGGAGRGCTVTLISDGRKIGTGRIEKTVPGIFSFDDFMDIGDDHGEPVVSDYGPGGSKFTGEIETVTIDVSGNAHHDRDLLLRAKHAKQ